MTYHGPPEGLLDWFVDLGVPVAIPNGNLPLVRDGQENPVPLLDRRSRDRVALPIEGTYEVREGGQTPTANASTSPLVINLANRINRLNVGSQAVITTTGKGGLVPGEPAYLLQLQPALPVPGDIILDGLKLLLGDVAEPALELQILADGLQLPGLDVHLEDAVLHL